MIGVEEELLSPSSDGAGITGGIGGENRSGGKGRGEGGGGEGAEGGGEGGAGDGASTTSMDTDTLEL